MHRAVTNLTVTPKAQTAPLTDDIKEGVRRAERDSRGRFVARGDTTKLTDDIEDGVRRSNTRVHVDTTGATQGMHNLRGAASGALSVIGRLSVVIGLALAAVGGFGLKAAGEFQQTTIAFEGILGSGEAAQAMLDQMRDFAAKTPFEFPELTRSAKNLLAVGFSAERVIPVMTTLGNVAAQLGVGGAEIEGVVRALGQMKGKGKASAEELQQISEQLPGFSAINAIAQSLGITTAEAFDQMEAGAIDANTAVEAILAGMDRFPGAAGAMERQSQTLLGVFSTMKDTLRDTLVDALLPMLPELSATIASVTPQIGTALAGLATAFMQVFTAIAPVLAPI